MSLHSIFYTAFRVIRYRASFSAPMSLQIEALLSNLYVKRKIRIQVAGWFRRGK